MKPKIIDHGNLDQAMAGVRRLSQVDRQSCQELAEMFSKTAGQREFERLEKERQENKCSPK